MTDLRVYYGKAFFAGEYKLSRQEWMSKNRLVYNMQVITLRKENSFLAFQAQQEQQL